MTVDAPPSPPALIAQAPAGDDFAQAEAFVRANDLVRADARIKAWLATHPNDPDARFLAGRIASWRGQHAEAVTYLSPLIIAHPENADYQAALGRAHAWTGERWLALLHLDLARSLVPADFELWVLEIRLLEELGGDNVAVATSLRRQAARRFSGRTLPPVVPPVAAGAAAVATFYARAVAPPVAWRVEGGAEAESLSRGLDPWYGATLAVTRQWSARQRAWVRLKESNRFALWDTEAAVGGTWPLRGPLSLLAELSGSPTNQVAPIVAGTAQVGLALDPWSAELRLRGAVYRLAFVPSATLSLDRYLGPFRAGWATTLTRAPDATLPLVHGVSVSWYPTDTEALTLGGGFGEEVEAVGASRVARTDTRSLFASGRLGLAGGWSLVPELAWIDQSAFFTRYRARIAVERAF